MFFRSIALITISDGLLKATGFFIIPIYLLWMPKVEYGEFGYILNTICMLPAIITLGLYVPQIKESSASDDIHYKSLVFSTTFTATTILTISLLSLLTFSGIYKDILCCIFLVSRNIGYKWIAISLIALFLSLNLIIYSHALGYQQSNKIITYNFLKFSFTNVFGLLFLYLKIGYSDAALDRLVGLAIAEALLCFLTFYWLARDHWIWKIDIAYFKSALRAGLPIIPGSFAALISAMSDRFFLGKFFDSSYIAEYNLALQILMPFQIVLTGAQTVWAPHIFSEKADDIAKEKSYAFFLRLLFLFLLLIPALMLLAFIAQKYNLIPSSYKDTILLIPSLSVGVIGLVLFNIPSNLFIRWNKTSWIAYISILGSIITVIGCAVTIPRYGYFGGAAVNGIVNIIMLSIAWWAVRKLNVRN